MSQDPPGPTSEAASSLPHDELESAFLALAVETRALLGLVPSSYTPRGKIHGVGDVFDVDRRHVPAHGLENSGKGEQERDRPPHRYAVLGTGVRLYPPTALEFARVVFAHAPAVLAGVPEALFPRAWSKWNDTDYLRSRMGDRKVKVAFTPNGRADDIVVLPEGTEGPSSDGKGFALPYEAELTFDQLFEALHPPPNADAPAAYLQSQNSNLCNFDGTEGDFGPLLEDLLASTTDPDGHSGAQSSSHATLHPPSSSNDPSTKSASHASSSPAQFAASQQPEKAGSRNGAPGISSESSVSSQTKIAGSAQPFGNRSDQAHIPATRNGLVDTKDPQPHLLDIPFASAVYGVPPEAVNIWFGTAASASSMHRDHYENLFVVLRGTKVFTLIPPWENVWIEDDQVYPVYRWKPRSASASGVPTSASDMQLVHEQGSTPWLTVDPTLPPTSGRNRGAKRYARGQRTHLIPPVRVVVRAGETLYLPAGWYHHVSQEEDSTSKPGDAAVIGLNFWYDAPLNDRWAWSNFATALRQRAEGTYDPLKEDDV